MIVIFPPGPSKKMLQIAVEPATLGAKGSDWKHPKVPPQLQATPAEPPWSLTCCLETGSFPQGLTPR